MALTYASGPNRAIDCPLCGQAARVDRRGAGLSVCCYGGCAPDSVEAVLRARGEIELVVAELVAPGSADGGSGRRVVLTPASAVAPERVRWALTGRVPLGYLTVLAGQPKLGKSTWAAGLAARLSVGGAEGDLAGQPVDIVLLSYEDPAAAVLVPRVVAAGGALARVHILEPLAVEPDGTADLVTLTTDLSRIDEACARVSARLLVVDPLMAGLAGATDAHRDQDVRRALAPLAQMAERHELAVLVVTHTTKARDGDMIRRIGASVGISGAARALLVMGPDPSDPDGADGTGRVLAARGNLSGPVPALAYQLEAVTIEHRGERIETSRLVERGEVDVQAHDLLAPPDQPDHAERESATDWLADHLADGEWHEAQEVIAAAKAAGHSQATIYRARSAVGVESVRSGAHGRAEWRVPTFSRTRGDREKAGDENTSQARIQSGIEPAPIPLLSHTRECEKAGSPEEWTSEAADALLARASEMFPGAVEVPA